MPTSSRTFAAIGQAVAVRPDDVTVSWLPLYHDMGLIGAWLGSLYHGVPLVLLSPLAFLSRPSRWLSAVHAYRGTVSAAPNFAFDLCVHKIADDEIQGSGPPALAPGDERLGSGERRDDRALHPSIRAIWVQRQRDVSGVRACRIVGRAHDVADQSARPCGHVAREPFERRRDVRLADAADPHALRFVSCGVPLPDHQVRIVDAVGTAARRAD